MGEEPHDPVQQLFLAALELPEERRESWLIEQCESDPILLSEIRSLLEHDSPTDDPLENPFHELISDVDDFARQKLKAETLQYRRPNQTAFHIRCPHCHNPIEFIEETFLTDIECPSCGSSFSLLGDARLPCGRSEPPEIANFKLQDLVGTGAFGSVWKAYDETLDRIVAIKIPRRGQLSPAASEQFLREARSAARLKHPNIVTVHEVGRDDQQIYIVSGFIDGAPLSDWLTANTLTPKESADLTRKIAEALHHAHEEGVIHRDLKPSNIMMDSAGEPHLVDFGLAKQDAGEITMTADGKILGTPAYMSPEQARGEAHLSDGRSDVYSLGVVLFEMLTGERPFRGDHRMLLQQVIHDDPWGPKQLNASVPRDLDTICLMCLEKKPSRRYATAKDLAADLRRHLEGRPISARPVTTLERTGRWCQRNPRVAFLAAVVFLLLAFVAASSTINSARLRVAHDETKQTLYDLNTTFGLDAQEPARALLWFAEAAKLVAPGSHQARACATRHVSWHESALGLAHYFDHDGETLTQFGYAPSGKFLATLTQKGECTVWELSKVANAVFSLSDVSCLAWNPSTAEIALAVHGNQVQIISMPGGEVKQDFMLPETINVLAYDQQATQLAIGGKSLRFWSFEDASITDTSIEHESRIHSVEYSIDGSKVLTATDDQARVFSTNSADTTAVIHGLRHHGTGFPNHPFVKPIFVDSDKGILTKSGQFVTWTDIESGEVRANIAVDGSPNATWMASSPDRQHFAISWQNQGYQIWSTADEAKIAEAPMPSGAYWELEYSPDGLDIALLTADSFRRIRSADGVAYGAAAPNVSRLQQLAWAPDGRHIAIADFQGRVAIWSTNSFLPYAPTSSTPRPASTVSSRTSQPLLNGAATRLKRSPKGAFVLAAGSNWIFGDFRQAALISTQSATVVEQVTTDSLLLDSSLSPSEDVLAIATLDRRIALRDLKAHGQLELLAELDSEPLRLAFGPTDSLLITLEINGLLTAFDTQTQKIIWTAQHPKVELPSFQRDTNRHMYRRPNRYPFMHFQSYNLQRSRDGKHVVTTCGNEIACVWDSLTGRHIIPPVHFNSGSSVQIDLSPDDRWLAITSDHTEVWDLLNGRLATRLNHPRQGLSVKFNSSGKRLAIFTEAECSVWDWVYQTRVCPNIPARRGVFAGPREEWLLVDQWGEIRLFSALTGRAVSPAWPLGIHPHDILISDDSSACYVSGTAPFKRSWAKPIDRLSLKGLMDPTGLAVQDMQLCAEILSGHKVQDGVQTKLSAEAWQERIRKAQNHPDLTLSVDWTDNEISSWHRNQQIRAMQNDNPFASHWHTQRLLRQSESSDEESELSFDGATSHVRIPGLLYRGDVPITLECFATATRFSSSESSVIANVNFAGIGFGLDRSGRWQAFWAQRSSGSKGYSYAYAKSETAAVAGRRVHIAAVFASGEVALFVDGRKVDSTMAGEHVASDLGFYLAADPRSDASPEQFFHGRIDEVRISDIARYNTDFVPATRHKSDPHTLLLCHMDEGQGLLIQDESDYRRDSWLYGADWSTVQQAVSPPRTEASHLDRARDFLSDKNWNGARLEYRILLNLRPSDPLLWMELMDIAWWDDWTNGRSLEGAMAIYPEAKKAMGERFADYAIGHALWCVLTDQQEEYERVCHLFVEEHSNSDQPRRLFQVAKICALGEQSILTPDQVVKIAKDAIEADPTKDYFRAALAHSLIRAGKTREALAISSENAALTALIHASAGNTEEARAWLQRAHTDIHDNPLDPRSTWFPNHRLSWRLFMRETERILAEQ